jgi:toxin HigB-1
MIRSWRNSVTRKVWDGERPNQFRGLDFEAAIDLLVALNVAKSLNDLSPLKSAGLHKLKGDRRRQWAMTVNERWRICFEFQKGDAHEVEIVDYHKGVPSGRITDILNGRRSITADTAVRLGRYFGNGAQFWLDLQSQYDIGVVEREKGAEIAKRVRPADAA